MLSFFKKLSTAVVAITVLTGAITAQADPYEREAWNQLVLLGGGSYPSDSFVGKILRGQTEVLTLTLHAYREYTIAGVCDRDCNDVDLALYDENGQLIDADYLDDDLPLVVVTPAWTGQFYIVITVPGCYAWRCTVGVGVFDGRSI